MLFDEASGPSHVHSFNDVGLYGSSENQEDGGGDVVVMGKRPRVIDPIGGGGGGDGPGFSGGGGTGGVSGGGGGVGSAFSDIFAVMTWIYDQYQHQQEKAAEREATIAQDFKPANSTVHYDSKGHEYWTTNDGSGTIYQDTNGNHIPD